MKSSTPTLSALDGCDVPDVRPLRTSGWLWLHLKIGLFGFGHGAIMPLYERALVGDTNTISPAQFNEALAASLLLPGPSLITLSLHLGKQLYGLPVAALAVVAMCLPGALWALLIVHAVPIHHPAVRALFNGFTVGALVLLASMVRRLALGLASASSRHPARKRAARYGLSLALALALFAHLPMTSVAVVGALVCLAVEFAL